MRFFLISSMSDKKIFLKKDCILILAVLLLTILTALITVLFQRDAGQTVRIMTDGKLYGEYSLTDNQIIVIDGLFGYNKVVIENGMAYVDDADCPDKYCMKYKPISKGNETIVCLPHRFIVEVVGKADIQQPDIIAQ
ncbi:MAG: NusG domain II-containing protein [Lachnospiraceae bacterium]|nr:NusG domain II-containing protein [Lachnospiraceae bacterium]